MTRSTFRTSCRVFLAVLAVQVLNGCGEGEPAPSDSGPTRASEPTTVEIDRLRALGYLKAVSEEERDDLTKRGVVAHDPARTQPGYNLYNEQIDASAVLMDMAGTVIHRFKDPGGNYWARVELLRDGGLIAIGTVDEGQMRRDIEPGQRYVMRLGSDGSVRWQARIGAHHDVEIVPSLSGGAGFALWTFAMHERQIPAIHPELQTRDDLLTLLDESGAVLEQHSLYDLLRSGPAPFAFADVMPKLEALNETRERLGKRRRETEDFVDLLHCNSVEAFDQPQLAERNGIYQPDSLLVTSRHQDTIAIVSTQANELRWSWGRGELSGPHDATWLADGNILVFDNGLGRNWSRIVEVDPATNEIVWQYRHPDPERFYTASRGSAQRLPNGNTLVSNSGSGQAFEITREGDLVWEWRNPRLDRHGRRATLGRMQRLDRDSVDALLRALDASQ